MSAHLKSASLEQNRVFILTTPDQAFLCPPGHPPVIQNPSKSAIPLIFQTFPPFPCTLPLLKLILYVTTALTRKQSDNNCYSLSIPFMIDNSHNSPYYRWGYLDLNIQVTYPKLHWNKDLKWDCRLYDSKATLYPWLQWFSTFPMHQYHLEGLLKQIAGFPPPTFWLSRSGGGLKICISIKFPIDTDQGPTSKTTTLYHHNKVNYFIEDIRIIQ